MNARWTLPAFAGCGLELEYMIVDGESLGVRPIADELLHALAARGDRDVASGTALRNDAADGGCGRPNRHDASDVARGMLGWSNELVRHVVEIKNVDPTAALDGLPSRFHDEVKVANRLLAAQGARLMPTAMHPWMDPATETVLWDDESEIYRTYDRIYGCRGHGWSNLQSMHVNLPFADDAEFERLHAAIRLVLPLVPALAASSPFAEGRFTGRLDERLENYRSICALTPAVSGRVIPETVATRAEYEARILQPMYDEIAPLDPAGVLRHEWLNSRAAIPRFERDAIEIRLVDVQECPQVDAAIAAAIVQVVRWLYDERPGPLAAQHAVTTEALFDVLLGTIRDAEQAMVGDAPYLAALGLPPANVPAGELWRLAIDASANASVADDTGTAGIVAGGTWWRPTLDAILREGPLARRILRATGAAPTRERLHDVYGELCGCLDDGRLFRR
jgi:glutamate---cysteine ligase / carboxylate-amine ligase